MSLSCKHYIKLYRDVFDKQPTAKEINLYRLYQCENCKRWFSLIGKVPKREGEMRK